MGSPASCKHWKLNLKCTGLRGACSRVSLHPLSSLATEKQQEASSGWDRALCGCFSCTSVRLDRDILPGGVLGASSRWIWDESSPVGPAWIGPSGTASAHSPWPPDSSLWRTSTSQTHSLIFSEARCNRAKPSLLSSSRKTENDFFFSFLGMGLKLGVGGGGGQSYGGLVGFGGKEGVHGGSSCPAVLGETEVRKFQKLWFNQLAFFPQWMNED